MARRYYPFSLIELLVVIAIIAMLAALLMPVIGNGPHPGPKWLGCMENMKQLDIAWVMYSNDNNDALSPLAARFAASQTNVWALGNAQTVPQDTARYGQLEPGVLDATNLHALHERSAFYICQESGGLPLSAGQTHVGRHSIRAQLFHE